MTNAIRRARKYGNYLHRYRYTYEKKWFKWTYEVADYIKSRSEYL